MTLCVRQPLDASANAFQQRLTSGWKLDWRKSCSMQPNATVCDELLTSRYGSFMAGHRYHLSWRPICEFPRMLTGDLWTVSCILPLPSLLLSNGKLLEPVARPFFAD